MVLEAADELRHPHDPDDPDWRESWYWNFSDPANEIGGWLYLWVVPNSTPHKSGMLVSFYHGVPTTADSNALAFAAKNHRLDGPNGSWVYCFQHDAEDLIEDDVDDVRLGGMHLERVEELSRYRLRFAEQHASFDLDCRWLTRPWDFADNVHPTPAWLAKNRYHRGWKAEGTLTIGGRTYDINTTGDSDHSWGTRDMDRFWEHNLKTYALQSPDGQLSVKAQMLGEPGNEQPRGYIALGDDMQAVRSIDEHSSYDEDGLMHDIRLRVEDVTGRTIEARMDRLYGAVSGGGTRVGFEGAGTWSVADWGPCAGLASCWWSNGVTADDLRAGRAGVTTG